MGGIERAFTQYLRMSGEWLDDAPEYFVVSKIADELCRKVSKGWITMEWPVRGTMRDARSKVRGRPHEALRTRGRFDVVVYWKTNGKPRAALEVKHPIWANTRLLDRDAIRLCRALCGPNGSRKGLQFGMLGYYASSSHPHRKDRNPTARLKRRRDNIKRSIALIARGCGCKASFHYGRIRRREGEAWMACCVRLQPLS